MAYIKPRPCKAFIAGQYCASCRKDFYRVHPPEGPNYHIVVECLACHEEILKPIGFPFEAIVSKMSDHWRNHHNAEYMEGHYDS